jgi:hypothetical protein
MARPKADLDQLRAEVRDYRRELDVVKTILRRHERTIERLRLTVAALVRQYRQDHPGCDLDLADADTLH